MYLGNTHFMYMVPVAFGNFLSSKLPKMVHFWLNWKCSEGGFTISATFRQQILQNLSRKIPMEKKVSWHQSWTRLDKGIYCIFCQKNAFFGQKMAFFGKVHFIKKWSVTQNTVFHWLKNNFLLSHQKLVFFTRFNLIIIDLYCVLCLHHKINMKIIHI